MSKCVAYNPPSYSIGRFVFLSGILSVLSGGTVILLTLVTINIISIISRCWNSIQICLMYGCALETMYSLLALVWRTTCHFQVINQTLLALGFFKTPKLEVHPPLIFLTISDWQNAKFRCSPIGPKVRILNTLTPLASIYVTLFHCRHPCEFLHASYWFLLVSKRA